MPQLDKFGQLRVRQGQARQRVVQGLDNGVRRLADQIVRFEIDTPPASAFGGLASAGAIDEDAAHGLGGGLQVVALCRERALAAELQERLVDERRGLKSLSRLFRS